MKVFILNSKIKKFVNKILFQVLYPLSQLYLSKERHYRYQDIRIKVSPGVFHPGLFLSTKILLKHLEKIDLNNKTLLELGAGTGLISIFAAKQNAIVTATDITSAAITNIKENAENNGVDVKVIQSDLFDNIPVQSFDLIIINPPYFPKDPKDEKECAWFCGSNFQFFNKLFEQVDNYINTSTEVIMILSEDCEIEKIMRIANKNSFDFIEIDKQRVWGEWNYLFNIKPEVPS